MLLATKMDRVFIIKEKGKELRLPDPHPKWSVEAVLGFLSNTYPTLTTAKISAPQIVQDKVEFRFESVMGTKG